MTDEQRSFINNCIFRISAGEEDALDDIYSAIGGRMLSIAFAVVRNRASAEDAVQESFMKIARYAHKFKKDTNGYAWICKIVQNTALNSIRSEKRFKAECIDDFYSLSDGKNAFEISSAGMAVEKAMNSLEATERKIIYMKYFLDYTVREIAKSIGISKSAVQRAVERAEEKLKICLSERDGYKI